jgi:hypothetical protein
MAKVEMKIKFVKQEDRFGCAVACIAMATGRTYEDVSKDFAQDFNKRGLFTRQITQYLADCGFQIIYKKVDFFNDIKFGRDELLKPFAPVHIVNVKQYFDAGSGHSVVMDKKGKIFCPNEVDEEEIKNAYCIDDVIGIYR